MTPHSRVLSSDLGEATRDGQRDPRSATLTIPPARQQPKRTNLPPLLRACPFRSLRVIYKRLSFEKYRFLSITLSLLIPRKYCFLDTHLLTSLNTHRAFPIWRLTKKHTTTLTHLATHYIWTVSEQIIVPLSIRINTYTHRQHEGLPNKRR